MLIGRAMMEIKQPVDDNFLKHPSTLSFFSEASSDVIVTINKF